MYVFCTRSTQVAKHYRTLAHQLHEGRPICLSKLILGSLYECLNDGVADMRNQVDNLIIPGPIWLFQLWLLATFKSKLNAFLPNDFEEVYTKRYTEGAGLALFRNKENETSQVLFSEAFKLFMDCDVFMPSLAPFSKRTCGPTWFVREFPTETSNIRKRSMPFGKLI